MLEEKIIERVGDHKPIQTDVRIITATNKDLKQLVDQGVFREDFYYRINVVPIWIPPLRERTGDIQLLAESFFQRIYLKSEKRIQGITNEALDFMIQYPWPGNVRELKNVIERSVILADGTELIPETLPKEFLKVSLQPLKVESNGSKTIGVRPELKDEILREAEVDNFHVYNT